MNIKHNLIESQNDYFFNNCEPCLVFIRENLKENEFQHEYQKTNLAANFVGGLEKMCVNCCDIDINMLIIICAIIKNGTYINKIFSTKQKQQMASILIATINNTYCGYTTYYIDDSNNNSSIIINDIIRCANDDKSIKLNVVPHDNDLVTIIKSIIPNKLMNIIDIMISNGYKISENTLFIILYHVTINKELLLPLKEIITLIYALNNNYITRESIILLFSKLSCDTCILNNYVPRIKNDMEHITVHLSLIQTIIDLNVPITFDMMKYIRINSFMHINAKKRYGNEIIKYISIYNNHIKQIVNIGQSIIDHGYDKPNEDTLMHACGSNCIEYMMLCLNNNDKLECNIKHLKKGCKIASIDTIKTIMNMRIEPNYECIKILISQHKHEDCELNKKILNCVEYIVSNGFKITHNILKLCVIYEMPFPKSSDNFAYDDSVYEFFHEINIKRISLKKYPLNIQKSVLKLRENCARLVMDKIMESHDKLDHYCYDNLLQHDSKFAVELVDDAIKNDKYAPNINSLLRITNVVHRKNQHKKYIDLVNSKV